MNPVTLETGPDITAAPFGRAGRARKSLATLSIGAGMRLSHLSVHRKAL